MKQREYETKQSTQMTLEEALQTDWIPPDLKLRINPVLVPTVMTLLKEAQQRGETKEAWHERLRNILEVNQETWKSR